MHSTFTIYRRRNLNACVVYAMTSGGHTMGKSVFHPSQTIMVLIHLPRGMEGLIGLRVKPEPRTSFRVQTTDSAFSDCATIKDKQTKRSLNLYLPSANSSV